MPVIVFPSWMDQAICPETDPELFHPETAGHAYIVREAKAVCARCPVRDECLEYALAIDERWGIWGGLLPSERDRLRPKKPKHDPVCTRDGCEKPHKAHGLCNTHHMQEHRRKAS